MNENEDPEASKFQDQMVALRAFWLDNLGLTIGEAVLCTTGGGEGFQGVLLDLMLSGDTAMPLVVIMETTGGLGRVNVRWDHISMITSFIPNGNDISAAEDAAKNAQDAVSVSKLVEFADSQGLDVPDDIRGLLDTPGL